MDGFAATDMETAALRAAFERFEETGVHGWILDMRWNGGGPSVQLSRLLIDSSGGSSYVIDAHYPATAAHW